MLILIVYVLLENTLETQFRLNLKLHPPVRASETRLVFPGKISLASSALSLVSSSTKLLRKRGEIAKGILLLRWRA